MTNDLDNLAIKNALYCSKIKLTRQSYIFQFINNNQSNCAFVFSSTNKLLNPSKTIPSEFLINVINNLKISSDAQRILVFLDLTAAFNTVYPDILIQRLHGTVGLIEQVLDWLSFYLKGGHFYVSNGNLQLEQLKI